MAFRHLEGRGEDAGDTLVTLARAPASFFVPSFSVKNHAVPKRKKGPNGQARLPIWPLFSPCASGAGADPLLSGCISENEMTLL